MHTKLIQDQIAREINKIDYIYDDYDRDLLAKMFKRIRQSVGAQYNYLAEIALHPTPNASTIVLPFFEQFHSESVRAFLLPQITLDNPKLYGEVIYNGYIKFKNSSCYISDKGRPAPTHIFSRYDKALIKTKPHALKWELFSLAKNPRDIIYLPSTMKTLASWRFQEMGEQVNRYFSAMTMSDLEFGFTKTLEDSYPTLHFMRRQLLFFAITCSPYYPTEQTVSNLRVWITSTDLDIRNAAKKALKVIDEERVDGFM